jgi:hypothetical protein
VSYGCLFKVDFVLHWEEVKRHTSGFFWLGSGRTGGSTRVRMTEEQAFSRLDDNISFHPRKNFCVTFVLL